MPLTHIPIPIPFRKLNASDENLIKMTLVLGISEMCTREMQKSADENPTTYNLERYQHYKRLMILMILLVRISNRVFNQEEQIFLRKCHLVIRQYYKKYINPYVKDAVNHEQRLN